MASPAAQTPRGGGAASTEELGGSAIKVLEFVAVDGNAETEKLGELEKVVTEVERKVATDEEGKDTGKRMGTPIENLSPHLISISSEVSGLASNNESSPFFVPQGAWKKRLLSDTQQQDVPVIDTSVWPSLTSGNQVTRNRRQQDAVTKPVYAAKTKIPLFSKTEEEALKAHSKDYPWAAKMDPSLRNLHRVTTPEFMEDGTPKVKIPSHVLLEGLENQKEFVVGQFYRCSAPSGGLIHAIVSRIWGKRCQIHTRKVGESSYLFHIPDELTRKWIIQRGLWHVDDCLMFVSAWAPAANLSLPEISTMPVWLTLKNIPDQLYSRKGINWIASGLGEPMLSSKSWLDPTQMGEAKILVEMKLDKPFAQKVALEDDSGSITMVDVIYSWLPPKCSSCGQLGHKERRCLGLLGEKHVKSIRIGLVPADSTTGRSDGAYAGTEFESTAAIADTAFDNAPIAPSNTSLSLASRIEKPSIPIGANEDSTSIDLTTGTATGDLVSLATISILENMSVSPTLVTINEFIESPTLESTQILSTTTTTSALVTIQGESCKIAEFGSGSNKFASLASREEEDNSSLDSETDTMKLMTPSGNRILRDRPVKPSAKAKETNWQPVGHGRGRRGRGNKGRNV